MGPPRFASLDLGTNTFRLLVAEAASKEQHSTNGFRVLAMRRTITRAGGGFTPERGIGDEARARILEALRDFRQVMDEYGVTRYRTAATSVFRRAMNAAGVIDEVRRETGLEINIISGDEEAELSASGVLAEVAVPEPALVFDIGGGSTEYVLRDGGRTVFRRSLEIGVVSLAEEVLHGDPLTAEQVAEARRRIQDALAGITAPIRDAVGGRALALVGTAGTVSTLAAVDLALPGYDRERINGHRLRRSDIEDSYHLFSRLPRSERAAVPGMEKGREDIIVPGCLIALDTMDAFGCESLVAGEGGLLEGLMHHMVDAGGVAQELRGKIR